MVATASNTPTPPFISYLLGPCYEAVTFWRLTTQEERECEILSLMEFTLQWAGRHISTSALPSTES